MLIRRRGLIAGVTISMTGMQLGRAGVMPQAMPGQTGTAPAADVPMPVPLGAANGSPQAAVPVPDAAPAPLAAAGEPARWLRYAVVPQHPEGRPIITIVIDDMGVMHANTGRAVALPGPLTLAWFPFAPRLAEQIEVATARGHETLLHMPMQAISGGIRQTGPDPLRIDLPPDENLARLRAAIDAIPNAVGLNNHMGSVATRDVPLMEIVARETRARSMLFLDSLTITHSVALAQARAEQVPSVARDVFIDNSSNPTLIAQQLELVEREARSNGRVVAIGHPRPNTLNALEAWLPTLADKGFVLWPLAATVAYENNLALPGGITI